MAIDTSAFDEVVGSGIDTSAFDDVVKKEQDSPTVAQLGAGFVTDLAIAEGGRTATALAGAAIGTAIAPGLGTGIGAGIGYVAGGLGFGAAGSIARQKIINPDEEISEGQLVADSLINLIPGFKGAKGLSFASRVGIQSGIGAGISAGSVAAETAIDEGRLPTLEELRNAGITGAVLGGGLGITGEKLEGVLSKYGGMPNRDFTRAFRRGDPDAKILVDGVQKTVREYEQEASKNIKGIFTDISEGYSDSLVRARVLQDVVAEGQYTKRGAPLKVKSDESDYYAARRVAEGKISARNEELERLVNADAIFLANKAKEVGADATDLSKGINDYLYAKHGIAYNKANRAKFKGDGASGRSTQDHQRVIDEFERKGLDKTLSESLDLRRDLSKRILNTLEDGGLVSKELANKLRKDFPDYVPLNRIMDSDDIDTTAQKIMTGAGRFETKSSGIRRAKGSELEVDAISQNIVTNLVQATRRAEVNKANQAFLKLLRDNPATAGSVATIKKPKVVGTQLVKDTSPEADAMRALGKKVPPKKVPIYERAKDDALTVFEDGKRVFVEFKDPRLAAALKGTNKEQVGQILRASIGINRFLGGLFTRFNPEFIAPNLFRDRSEGFVNAMAKIGPIKALKLLNPAAGIGTLTRNVLPENLSNRIPRTARDIENDAMYKEFVEAGGQTGGLGLSTIKDVEKNIEKLAERLDQPTKSKVRYFNGAIRGINEIVENSTRFQTYKLARMDGMTPQQAALAARNSSFDPQLQGSRGDTIRALYLFSNPAIQGAKNFLRSLKNPTTRYTVMGALLGTTYVIDQYNKSIDPNYRDKIPDWKLNKHLTFVRRQNPDGTLEYASIPIGYSMVPFKVAADYAQRMILGGEDLDPVLAGKELAKNVIDSYNPMGGSIIPTPLRIAYSEVAANKDGLGRDIRPSWLENQNVSDVVKIHPWTARTQGGELAMVMAEQVAELGAEVSPETMLYYYRMLTGGPGKTVERLFNVAAKMYNGEKVDRQDVPVLRRFYGETYAEAFENRTGREQRIENIEKQENTSAAKASLTASNYKAKIRNAKTPAERSRIIFDMLDDPEANAAVIRRMDKFFKDEELGITAEDKRVRGMNVDTRVQYYLKELARMDKAEGTNYLLEQKKKGVLSKSVEEKLTGMKAFKDFFE
jgi:hypothetical protein